MKKLNYTNEKYSIAVKTDKNVITKVNYLFKGNDAIKYIAYDYKENANDKYYLDKAKVDFHEYKKTMKCFLYSYKYTFIESTTPKRRLLIGALQSILILGIITAIILICISLR